MNEQKFIQNIMRKRDMMIDNSDKLYLAQFGNNPPTPTPRGDKAIYGVLLIFSILIILICAVLLSYTRTPVINNEYDTRTYPTTINNPVQRVTEHYETVINVNATKTMVCLEVPGQQYITCYNEN